MIQFNEWQSTGGSELINFAGGFVRIMQAVHALYESGEWSFRVDANSTANDTAVLIKGNGALKRVKMETASGGKRILYVDE